MWIFICTSRKIFVGALHHFGSIKFGATRLQIFSAGKIHLRQKSFWSENLKLGFGTDSNRSFGPTENPARATIPKEMTNSISSEHFSIPIFKITLVANSAIARALHNFSCWRTQDLAWRGGASTPGGLNIDRKSMSTAAWKLFSQSHRQAKLKTLPPNSVKTENVVQHFLS